LHSISGSVDPQFPINEADTVCGSEPRQTLLLRTVKLIADGSQHLCILRKVSGTGVTLRLFHARPRARSYALETANGNRYPLEPDWSEGPIEGFRFIRYGSIQILTDDLEIPQERHDIRLQSPMAGSLQVTGRDYDIWFVNVSQHGACIECNGKLMLHQLVRIQTAILPEILAKVCWRKCSRFGLVFEQTFRYDELAKMLAPEV